MSFARNVLRLGGGNVASQVISILAVPVITRLYAPDEFGAFSFMFSLVAIAFPIATLRWNSAILLPADEETADRLLLLAVASVIVSAVVVMPLVALALARAALVDDIARPLLWFLAAGVLAHGLVHCCELWLLRHKQFGVMAWGAIGESLADRLFVIAAGLAGQATGAFLALGRVIGSAVHLAVFLRARPPLPSAWRGRPAAAELKATMRRYREFPLYSSWAYLFANGGRELPTLIFAAMFSASVAGMYALGVRVLGFPMLLIGDAVARVFLRYAVELAAEPARLLESTRLLVRSAFYLIFPPMLLLGVLGPQLFDVVFGPEWFDAGRYAQILALSFLVTFLYRVLSVFFDIHERQRMRLGIDAAQLAARTGAMVLGGLGWGVEGAVWGLLAATVLVHGAAVVYLLSLAGLGAVGAAGLFATALVNLLPLALLLAAAGPVLAGGPAAWALAAAVLAAQVYWLARREPRLLAYAEAALR